jgi:hypothetical protein
MVMPPSTTDLLCVCPLFTSQGPTAEILELDHLVTHDLSLWTDGGPCKRSGLRGSLCGGYEVAPTSTLLSRFTGCSGRDETSPFAQKVRFGISSVYGSMNTGKSPNRWANIWVGITSGTCLKVTSSITITGTSAKEIRNRFMKAAGAFRSLRVRFESLSSLNTTKCTASNSKLLTASNCRHV